MDVLHWNSLVSTSQCLYAATAVSVGGFDGPHRGHQYIFERVLQAARCAGVPAGLITFARSPRAEKMGNMYRGDISTLRLRLQKFQECGFDFIVLIDFSKDFATMSGITFFNILMKTICIHYLAVGSDFTCGYRHDTGVSELRNFALQKGFCFDSIETVCSDDAVRISSSMIRTAVEQADFSRAKDLLGYPFCLDVKNMYSNGVCDCRTCCFGYDANAAVIRRSTLKQIVPANGVYKARVYDGSGGSIAAYVTVAADCIAILCDNGIPRSPHTNQILLDHVEFIRKE